MTAVEIARKIRAHLETMDHAAAVPVGRSYSCRFRTPEGERCLLGALIPDELYEETMEVTGFGDMIINFPALVPYMVPSDLGPNERDLWVCFALEVQSEHDDRAISAPNDPPFRDLVLEGIRQMLGRWDQDDASFLPGFREVFA